MIPRRVPGRRTFAVAVGGRRSTSRPTCRARCPTRWSRWRGASGSPGGCGPTRPTSWRWPSCRSPSGCCAGQPKPAGDSADRPPGACSGSGPASCWARSPARDVGAADEYAAHPVSAQPHHAATSTCGSPGCCARSIARTTPESLAATLGPSDLDDPRAMTLASGDVAALDGPPGRGTSPVGLCTTIPAVLTPTTAATMRRRDPGDRRRDAGPDGHAEAVGRAGDGDFICPRAAADLGVRAEPGPGHAARATDTLGISNSGGTLALRGVAQGRTARKGGPTATSRLRPSIRRRSRRARPPPTAAARRATPTARALQSRRRARRDATARRCPRRQSRARRAQLRHLRQQERVRRDVRRRWTCEWNAMCAERRRLGARRRCPAICRAGACADAVPRRLRCRMCPRRAAGRVRQHYLGERVQRPYRPAWTTDGTAVTCRAVTVTCKSPVRSSIRTCPHQLSALHANGRHCPTRSPTPVSSTPAARSSDGGRDAAAPERRP